MKYKGIFHIHSTYSHDGNIALEKIRDLAKSRGFDFMVITEHNDNLDSKRTKAIEQSCQELSSDDFVIIPGIEVRCKGDIHLLSIGRIAEYEKDASLSENINRSHELGNLAIIAHPALDFLKQYPEIMRTIDGFEVWNNKEDSRWVPNMKAIRQFRGIRDINRSCFAYAGLDLHEVYQFASPWLIINATSLSYAHIIEALKNGGFANSNGFLTLSSTAEFDFSKYWRLPFMCCIKAVSRLCVKLLPLNFKTYLKRTMEQV